MSKQNLALDYALYMKNHGYGYPLYHPISQSQMSVLSIGYFNENGVWQKIASLGDVNSLKRYGLSQPTDLEAAPPQTVTWEPKGSSTIKKKKLGVKAELDSTITAGLVSAKVITQYSSSTDHGALLVTSPDVVIESYKFQQPFEDWMKQNYKTLVKSKLGRDIRAHGLFVVTQTCATTACAVCCWHGNSVDINLEFDAGAQGLVSAGIYGGWSVQESDIASWNHHVAPKNDKLVVFASGIQFKFTGWFQTYSPRFRAQQPNIYQTWRDSDDWIRLTGFFRRIGYFVINITRFQIFSDALQRSLGSVPHSDLIKAKRLKEEDEAAKAVFQELCKEDLTDIEWERATQKNNPCTHFEFEVLEVGGDFKRKSSKIDYV